MKTILVPVDFTNTSKNAIGFAAEWSRQFDYQRIILLKTFYDTMFDDIVLSLEYGNVNQEFRLKERQEAEEHLLQLGRDLSLKNKNAEVLTLTSELPLVRAVMQVIEEEKTNLVIMGSDNNEYDNDSYVAGHVIQIAKASPVKVLVVPAGQEYQPLKEVVIPVDAFAFLNKIKAMNPSSFRKEVKFTILNLNVSKNNQQQEEQLHEYLQNVNHAISSVHEKDPVDAIIKFLQNHSVQLIVALPGRYSFLYRLTHKNISEAICRNTKKPVLILK